MRKSWPILLPIGLATLLVAGSLFFIHLAQAAAPHHVLMLNTALNEGSLMVQGFHRLSARIYERSEGRLELQVFPGGQLGSDDEVVEQLRQGLNVAILTDGSQMGNFVPEMGLLMAPYLAETYDDFQLIVQSDLFAEWSEELADDFQMRILSFNWYDGPRHFLTNRPVRVPADLTGVRIRTPGSPMFQESVRHMGAVPIAMPFGESYPALAQGAIDGLEVQLTAAYASSLYEVTSYINRTGHFQMINGIVTSERWFESLPADLQQILLEEFAREGEYTARIVLEQTDRFQDYMIASGMTVIEPDIAAFREATEGVYDVLGLRELRDRLFAETGLDGAN